MEYEVEFELNRNTLEFQGELHPNNMQANLILKFTPEKLSQLVNDTGFITASALIPLENDIVEIENDMLGLQNDISDLQDTKVDKVTGKGLSTNDFTNALKTKLEGIEAGAEVNKVNSVNGQTGDVVIEIPDSATWGNITGTLSNQTDLQQALNAKQNTISDLDEIRAGASAGATAVQPSDLATVATTGDYDDLLNKPTIPTVNDATLTIQKNGTTVNTFTANASSNVTANITVPTDTGDLTNNAGYITSSALTPLQNDITTINSKIPSQATSTNQLADKDFVNSSIATNTANFIGTFENESTLEAYSGTVTNNDYAFVVNSVVTDNGNDWATFASLDAYSKTHLTNFDYAWVINGSNFDLYRFDIVNQEWVQRATNISKTSVTLNTAYNRYKATATNNTVTWEYEYTLNNSSFTAAQWAAINSGITSGDVSLIGTALQPNDNITQLTNNAGYITGITSTDVTNALGYTPYNSSNPNGYTSNVGTVTSVNNVSPTNGNVTLSIPTVNDATLTITQGGTTKGTFTANASSNTTIDLDAGNTYTAGTGLKLSNNDTEFNIMQQDINAEAVNVVGTLTENNNVWSGFSNNNYLTLLQNLSLSATDEWEIQFKFLQNSIDTNYRYIMLSDKLYIFVFNGYVYVYYPLTGVNPYYASSAMDTQVHYRWVKVKRELGSGTFTTVCSISTDGTNWTTFKNLSTTGTPYAFTSGVKLGAGSTAQQALNGSIDLNECYIKINGTTWWSGQGQTAKSVAKATTSLYGLVKPDGTSITVNNGVISAVSSGGTYTAGTGLDLTNDEFSIVQTNSTTSNFSVVGSPTITDGVASNFSDSNYLKFDYPLDTTMTSFEIVTAFKITTLGISNQALIDTGNMGGDTTKPTAFRLTITSSNQLLFRTSTDGNQNYVVNITGSTTLSANTKYWVKVTYSSTSGYVMSLSTNGTTWTSEATSSLTSRPYYYANNLCYIGDNIASGLSLNGYVYLNDTYVKVNGSIVWTPYTVGGVAMATDSLYGLVKPDSSTITVNNGVISGFSGSYNDLSDKPYAMVIEDFTA